MKRRSFFAIWCTCLGIVFAALAVAHLRAGDQFGYGYVLLGVGNLYLAVRYVRHPAPMDRPDEPAPQKWFQLTGVLAIVVAVVLAVALFLTGSI